jgi:hypothetical protein
MLRTHGEFACTAGGPVLLIERWPGMAPRPEMGLPKMSMTETTGRRALAEHGLLTVNGGPTDDFAEANAVTYKHLKTGGEHRWAWDGANEAERRMLALFGARTLMTNEASQVKQKGHAGIDPTPAIADRFKLLASGQWVDRTREGFAVNLDALAGALVDEFQVNGKAVDYTAIRERMETDKEFVKKARSNPGVNARYIEKIGRTTATVDELEQALGAAPAATAPGA